MKNIVLIGMPGSGKSTIGKLLSQNLDMNFIDMDEYIERSEQKSIKELFAQGEYCFRDAETRCAKKLSSVKSHVLAAGGGIVIRKENIDFLKKNSVIIFLNRPVEKIIQDIDCGTRPLLANGAKRLYDLYNERIFLYKSYCDIEILNTTTIQDTVKKVIRNVENSHKREQGTC
ncbi:MAG: shikimate kinase [Sedimentibacter sp.]|uniref:shikimate kinase n=1 Tax=Sedimentibacter sp. TaxID=1960295 RepID=UPI0031591C77